MMASLPMYWRVETAAAWHQFWDVVRAAAQGQGMALPDLTSPDALPEDWQSHWQSPDLVLSQTCGLPFRTALRDRVTYVATFDFGLGGPPGHYHSQIIARRGLGAPPFRLAYNAADSQSGWAAAQVWRDRIDLGGLVQTGAHAASLHAVAEGRADIAFLDAVTWRLLQRFDPAHLKVDALGITSPTPGLPLITAKECDPAPLRRALEGAISQLSPQTQQSLGGLRGLAVLDPRDYYAVPVPPSPLADPAAP